MQYLVKIENSMPSGAPVMADNVRLLFPGLPERYLFAADLEGTGFAGFMPTRPPANDNPLLRVIEALPTEQNSDGEWLQRWEIVERDDLTEDERVSLAAQYLATRKARLRAQVNAERDRREAGAFSYQGKQLDGDERSVKRILTSVQAAQLAVASGQPFEIDWVCADNSILSLDAQGMIGLPAAMAAHGYALHQHGREIKAQIDAAGDLDALAEIDPSAGWPG